MNNVFPKMCHLIAKKQIGIFTGKLIALDDENQWGNKTKSQNLLATIIALRAFYGVCNTTTITLNLFSHPHRIKTTKTLI